MVDDRDQREGESQGEAAPSPEASEQVRVGPLRSEVPAELRDVSFPNAVRGYDRRAVDSYVERVNQVIAELEVSRSPQAAVRHALDRVGQQTSGVLQRAREVAEELTGTALAEAEETTRTATAEAEDIVEDARMQAHQLRAQSKEQSDEIVGQARAEAQKRLQRLEDELRALQDQAEGRLRELQVETDAASAAHRRTVDELRRTAAELEKVASAASERMKAARPASRRSQTAPSRPDTTRRDLNRSTATRWSLRRLRRRDVTPGPAARRRDPPRSASGARTQPPSAARQDAPASTVHSRRPRGPRRRSASGRCRAPRESVGSAAFVAQPQALASSPQQSAF